MRPKTPHYPWRHYRATVSAKGQITIRVALQRHLGWRPGNWFLGGIRNERFALRRVDPTLGRAIRACQRRSRTSTDDAVLLLAILDDPIPSKETLAKQLAQFHRGERKEVATR